MRQDRATGRVWEYELDHVVPLDGSALLAMKIIDDVLPFEIAAWRREVRAPALARR